jgi:hypothetical protein
MEIKKEDSVRVRVFYGLVGSVFLDLTAKEYDKLVAFRKKAGRGEEYAQYTGIDIHDHSYSIDVGTQAISITVENQGGKS